MEQSGSPQRAKDVTAVAERLSSKAEIDFMSPRSGAVVRWRWHPTVAEMDHLFDRGIAGKMKCRERSKSPR
jgi:hypothetical protein